MIPPRIAVLGDVMEDRYYLGDTTRLSPEVPVPIVNITDVLVSPGGAANVVENLESLGAEVLGKGVWFLKRPIKSRLMVGDYQLARWDMGDKTEPISTTDIAALGRQSLDAVIISDYGKGSITYEVIEAIADLKLPTYIDSKRSPRDFDVIANPVFFPNLKEYREHLRDYDCQPQVIVKRSEEGIQQLHYGRIIADLPSWATKVVSVCGAGDTVIAAYVYAVYTDQHPLEFANAAASVVVGKPYTATATPHEVAAVLRMKSEQVLWGV